MSNAESGITGRVADLYDVFVDWPGRLRREMPGLVARLREVGARRVLDLGCGTGRHVRALLDEGFDAYGADVSEDMLRQARAHVGDAERLVAWRLGDPPPAALEQAEPFDAVIALGNVWSLLPDPEDVAAAGSAARSLLRPGGVVVLGLKAVSIRVEEQQPYLPLLRREKGGEVYFFVRFLDLATVHDETCEFHIAILRGDAEAETRELVEHRVVRWRVWSPATLEANFLAAGFDEVRASARIDDPDAATTGEDIYLHARLM